jgi:hypothetical protein
VNPVAAEVADLTPGWLAWALGHEVASVSCEPIGTGQIGTSYRLTLGYDGVAGPPTLVAKLAGGDPAARERVKEGYATEVAFYTQLAGTVDVRAPRCWYGAISEDHTTFTLLLDDLAPAVPGVQAEGCTLAQAADAVRNLAGLHAPRWNDEALFEHGFLRRTDPATAVFVGDLMVGAAEDFVAQYAAELSDEDAATLGTAAKATSTWQLARPEPFSLLHGDYRLDNLMFAPAGDGVTALDWQTATVGPPLRDVAYFLGTSIDPELRRAHEQALVGAYHEAIVARGVVDYDIRRCWDDYRLGHLQGPMITVLGCMFATAQRSDRADRMFLAMATRSCAAIRDLGSLDLL